MLKNLNLLIIYGYQCMSIHGQKHCLQGKSRQTKTSYFKIMWSKKKVFVKNALPLLVKTTILSFRWNSGRQ